MYDPRLDERLRRATRGIIEYPQRVVTDATHTVEGTDYHILADSTSNSITINLPPVEQWIGRNLWVTKVVAANTVTLDADGTDEIIGAGTYAITTQWTTITLRGTEDYGWVIV